MFKYNTKMKGKKFKCKWLYTSAYLILKIKAYEIKQKINCIRQEFQFEKENVKIIYKINYKILAELHKIITKI